MLKIKSILVVGLGSIGRRHLRIIKKQHPNINLFLLRHHSCESSDKHKYGLVKCVTSLEQALALRPDAAIIATPATKHIEVAITLANSGVHLLIEKPISDVPDGVEHLINTCKNKNITLMVGYNLRFNPTLQEFRKSILQKKIGKVLSVKVEVGQYLPNWRPDSDYRKSVSAQKKLGGGVLLELSHEVDYIGWIFGKYSWVKSHISKQSDLEIDVEDSASMIFGLNINQGSEVVVSLNMDFIRHDSMRQCTVIGDEGSLRWDGIKGEVSIFQKNSKEWSLIFSQSTDRDYTYKCEISDFIAAIEKNKKVTITGQDGLKVVQVIDAIHQSYKNNTMIVL